MISSQPNVPIVFTKNCIESSVKHGNQQCPLCRCTWKEVPFQFQTPINEPQSKAVADYVVGSSGNSSESQHFSDDEPHLVLSNSNNNNNNTSDQAVTVKALAAFSAICAAESPPAFPVLTEDAPCLTEDAPRSDRAPAPVDLVTVLDISGSMAGTKLALLKHAVSFVISSLGPADRLAIIADRLAIIADRLAIIAFSSDARRIFPLCLMSDTDRACATMAVNSLMSGGVTNIVEGLKKGVKVLDDRRERNPVASIILLSDGMDTYNGLPSPHDQAYSNSSSWISSFSVPLATFHQSY